MSEAAPFVEVLDLTGMLGQVDALRSAEPRPDPVRLHYIEALARRMQIAPPTVQKLLQAKLKDALKAMGSGGEIETSVQAVAVPLASEAGESPVALLEPADAVALTPTLRKTKSKVQPALAVPVAPLSLLGQLNQYIRSASLQAEAAEGGGAVPKSVALTHPQDLKSAIRFRETWARISAETEVDQATNRAPENAGPLNAHNLVLRTLSLMRGLSPDYLRRFMGQTETLLWLDQAYGQLKQPAGKAKLVKAGKAKR